MINLTNTNRLFVGFEEVLSDLSNGTLTSTKYPPYSVVADQDGHTKRFEFACAGFSKDQISVTTENDCLQVKGKRQPIDSTSNEVYTYQGIARRDFSISIPLYKYYRVSGATLENGILSVELSWEVPDEKKPKVVEIK